MTVPVGGHEVSLEDLAPVPGSLMSPDDALDQGASGLVFFEQFLPAARRIGIEDREYSDYRAAFDAERGLDVHALEVDADAARVIASTAQAATEEHRAGVNTLSSAWWGDAGHDAVVFAGTVRDRGDDTAAQVVAVAEALGALPDTLRQAVQTKSFVVASLHQTTVAGYTAHQIDTLVDIAERAADGGGYLVERLVADAASWFPKIASVIAAHESSGNASSVEPGGRVTDSPELRATVARIARDWLRDWFAPCYRTTRTLFDDACTHCAETVRAAYCAVSEEAQKVTTGAYPSPSGWAPAPVPQQAFTASPTPAPNYTAPAPNYTPAPAPAVQSSPPPHPSPHGQPRYAAGPDYGPPSGYSAGPGQVPGPGYGGRPGFLDGEVRDPHQLGDLGDLGDRGGVAGSLSTLLGEVRSLVEPMIEDAVSALTIDDSTDDPEPVGEEPASDVDGQPPEPGGSPDAEKSLELKSDGKTWTLAVDEDGKGISLRIEDGLGESTRYAIELGSDGIPRIVVEDGILAEETAADDETPEDPACEADASTQNAVETGGDAGTRGGVEAPADAAQAPTGPTDPPSPEPVDSPAADVPEGEVHDAQSGEPELASVSPEGTSTDTESLGGVSPENVSSVGDQPPSDPVDMTVSDTGAELAEAGPLASVDR
ncbi:MAG: hypothetical protein GX610_06795 [Rhodococcus sp.]|nr:hypothetical protein [Rhodococcus sp. (in: high G+C Gram-positive bacteria)]